MGSRKPEVAFIANMAVSDNRTVMGKTMASLVTTLQMHSAVFTD